ncbi:MAG: single-stranded-DNA-specific exonuclease RecJ [Anaerovoracaceae bacterium]
MKTSDIKSLNPVILKLLKNRGISKEEDIIEFLSDKPQKTYDPFLLSGLEAGVDLLLSAIKNEEKICIYGDYDADGITSTSILMEFLSKLTHKVEYYIPSRFSEGYGMNTAAVKKIHDRGAQVIVTVDCGSVSPKEVEYAKELGMKVIVTDHHSITDVKSDCIVINPKQEECKYPFPHLAGCGVAFKLAQGIQKKANLPKSYINELLDIVSIGTIGDIVPLVDENRTLVKHGMNILNSGRRQSIARFVSGISLTEGTIKSDQVSFAIVPHLNAAGRMKDAKIGVELFTAKDKKTIDEKVGLLAKYNQERKNIQEEAYQNCVQIVEENHKRDDFIVIHGEDIHEGIAGIVAGKLKDKYQRPVMLLVDSEEGILKGTGRSIPKVDLYEILKKQEELFTKFGGHQGACGLSMARENLKKLRAGLQEEIKHKLEEDPQLFNMDKDVDMIIEGKDITLPFAMELETLGPFGEANPKPYFALNEVKVVKPFPMGKEGTHLRFTAKCPDGALVECILFGKAQEVVDIIYSDNLVNLTGSVQFQEWRGKKKVQFLVDTMI